MPFFRVATSFHYFCNSFLKFWYNSIFFTMNRRNIYIISFFWVMIASFVSCTDNSPKKQVETINQQCPIDLGILGKVTEVGLDNQTIVYHVETNSDVLKLSRLKDHVGDVKKGILLNFVDDSVTLSQFIAAKCNIRYEYTDATTSERLVINVSQDELKNAVALVSDEKELARRRIENFVATGRLQLPLQVDEVTTLTDIVIEDGNVGYIYELDEDKLPSEKMKDQLSVLKENIAKGLESDDVSMNMLVDALTKDHKGLVYRYVLNKSGEKVEITFSPEEVAGIK